MAACWPRLGARRPLAVALVNLIHHPRSKPESRAAAAHIADAGGVAKVRDDAGGHAQPVAEGLEGDQVADPAARHGGGCQLVVLPSLHVPTMVGSWAHLLGSIM